jgi:hypothetical protein
MASAHPSAPQVTTQFNMSTKRAQDLNTGWMSARLSSVRTPGAPTRSDQRSSNSIYLFEWINTQVKEEKNAPRVFLCGVSSTRQRDRLYCLPPCPIDSSCPPLSRRHLLGPRRSFSCHRDALTCATTAHTRRVAPPFRTSQHLDFAPLSPPLHLILPVRFSHHTDTPRYSILAQPAPSSCAPIEVGWSPTCNSCVSLIGHCRPRKGSLRRRCALVEQKNMVISNESWCRSEINDNEN